MQVAKGHNLSRVKVTNQSAIRETIYHLGPISRLEISERLGLTLPTITTNVASLITKGLVKEVDYLVSPAKTLGRRTSLIDIVEDSKYFLGVEMRGSLRRACITDYRGNVLKALKDDTFYADYDECIQATGAMIKRLIRNSKLPKDKIALLGICTPGLVDTDEGVLTMHPGYKWENKPVAADIARCTGYTGEVVVENNARARAYGAHLFCQDYLKKAKNFAYLYVSAGLACPLFTNSISFHGNISGSGEVGHMVMDPDGPKCSCGNNGCLEAYSSERAVIEACTEAIAQGRAPILTDLCADKTAPTIYEILKAQAAGDAAAQAIMEDAVRHLGLAIANIDNFVRPDSILIECNYFEHLPNRELLLSVIHKNLYTATPADVKFSFITPDPFSGAKGAAAVAICKDLETYVE